MNDKKVKVEGEGKKKAKVGGEVKKTKPAYTLKDSQAEKSSSETYEKTYDDFFHWCLNGHDYPKLFFGDFVKLANLYDASGSEIVRQSISSAIHECWVKWFEKAKFYLDEVAGTKKDEPVKMWKPGFADFFKRTAEAQQKGGVK